MKWAIYKKNRSIFVIAVVLIAAIGAISYLSLERYRENTRRTRDTREVIKTVQTLFSLLQDAETGQRGYLLAGQEQYLEPYQKATNGAIAQQIKMLRRMTADNPHQQQRLDVLEPLVKKRLAELAIKIQIRREKGLAATLETFKKDSGKKLMDEIRVIIAAMQYEENILLLQRVAQARVSAEQTTVLIVGGSILASILVAVAAIAIERELSRRRKAETALSQSEARYRGIIEDQTELIARFQPDKTLTFVNEAFCRYFGVTREQVIGKPYEPIVFEEDREYVAQQVSSLNIENSLVTIENRVIVDGQIRWTQWINRALFDSQGNFIEYQSVGRDISDRKQAEAALNQLNDELETKVRVRTQALAEANQDLQTEIAERLQMEKNLQESEEKYRKLVELCPDAIFVQNEGKFVYVNNAAIEFFGAISSQELLGQSIDNFLAPETQNKIDECIRLLIEENRLIPLSEEKWLRVDGSIIYGELAAIPFAYKDEFTVQVVIRDITDRKLAEDKIRQLNAELEGRVIERTAQLEAANKELEAFSYSVSHDLRSPLRSIDGFSQALIEDYGDELDAVGRDYLQRVRKAAQRMAELIDDMLHLSRVTRSEMHYEKVDLSELATEIASELQNTQPDRQVEFAIAPDLVATGDKQLLKILLENLLGNAWKFTAKHQKARIEFGITQCNNNCTNCTYFVRDDGAGFDMAYVNKLFGAFQRLHAITDFEGSGIGLATVQRIVRRHGGRIWAKGAVEQGATFFFSLLIDDNGQKNDFTS
jgi:PAS domain S-box-containing protein